MMKMNDDDDDRWIWINVRIYDIRSQIVPPIQSRLSRVSPSRIYVDVKWRRDLKKIINEIKKAFAIQCSCPTCENHALLCTFAHSKFRFSQQYNKTRLYMSVECVHYNKSFHVFGLFDSVNRERARVVSELFRWKTIGIEDDK